MKRTTTTLIFIIVCSGLYAQYKKASFFQKEGRTYGLGSQLYALGDGRGAVVGFNLSFGRDQDGKRLFSFWELRLIPSFDFSYTTTDLVNDQTVTISGQSKMQFIYAVNYGWYILKNKPEQVFKPYLTAGFNIVMFGGIEDWSLSGADPKMLPMEEGFSGGIGGGAGGIFNLCKLLSIKVEGGYTHQINFEYIDNAEHDIFAMIPPHPYASLGLRFRITKD